MRKAQAEIDAVVGSDGETMPSFQHLDALPYTAALTKEVLRWMPAAPGGFPHYSDHDDEYKGFKVFGCHFLVDALTVTKLADQSKYNGHSMYMVHAGQFYGEGPLL